MQTELCSETTEMQLSWNRAGPLKIQQQNSDAIKVENNKGVRKDVYESDKSYYIRISSLRSETFRFSIGPNVISFRQICSPANVDGIMGKGPMAVQKSQLL
ncbi:hypothetical protein K0M31_013473 [Melipona bicolor]|uniref:Uncharacterized protein n=1 Tax=Melipona bicolor TaxID=60889 RepID=A0AA40KGA4_9HYME|nr:hypothetical protein K0M31_013473 [Melipona bicolor]